MATAKPTVCVDLDDVLAVTIPAFAKFHNCKYCTELTAADFHSYEFYKVFGGSKAEGIAKLEEFVLTDDFRRLDPIPEAAAVLRELAPHFRFVVVTARHLMIADKTRAWLDVHYPGIFDDVLMSNAYAKEGAKRSKAELCASVDAIAFIDDNETYIHEVAHSFIEAAKAKAEAEAARAAAGATAGTSTHDASASASTAPAPGRLPHSDPGTVILFGQYAWQHSHKPEAASAGAAPVMPHNVRRAHSWREVHALLMSLLPSTAAAMAVAAVA